MQRGAEIVLSLAIVATTLVFGGVQPLMYSLMEIALFAIFLAVLFDQARRGPIVLHIPVWPLLFALLVVFQIIPLPIRWVARLSPTRLLPTRLANLARLNGHAVALSLDPHATILNLMKFLAYLCAFALAAYVFDSRQRKSLLIRVLIFLGLFEAAYGTIQDLTGWQKIWTMKKIYYTAMATGTFINHNHFAGFLELTFPFVFATIFYYFQIWQDGRRRGPSRTDPATARSAAGQAVFYAFLLTISVIGVVLSRSRAGILAVLFSLVFIGLLAQLKTRRKTWALGLAIFILVAVGYGLWIGLNPVLERFAMFEGGTRYLQQEGRLSTWQATLKIVYHHPFIGIGLGTFRYGFLQVQTYMVNYYFTHAHNDYVELLAETGWLGFSLLIVPIFVLLIRMIYSFITDPRRYRTAVTLGCIGSALALLIHSAADFNLHIPSNALVFATVLGIGYKAACIERKGERLRPEASSHPAIAGRVPRKSKTF